MIHSEPRSFEATSTKDTPTPQFLRVAVQLLDSWFLRYVESLTAHSLYEQLAAGQAHRSLKWAPSRLS